MFAQAAVETQGGNLSRQGTQSAQGSKRRDGPGYNCLSFALVCLLIRLRALCVYVSDLCGNAPCFPILLCVLSPPKMPRIVMAAP